MTEGAATEIADSGISSRPLIVDLDGALVRSDLFIETLFLTLLQGPKSGLDMFRALLRGKAALKDWAARSVVLDPSILPYDDVVISYIRKAKSEGRPVYLVSANNQRVVGSVADHLGLFTGWFASDETVNLSGETKARRLVAEFNEGGFDYVGDDIVDPTVWARVGKPATTRVTPATSRDLINSGVDVQQLAAPRPRWRTWVRLLRVHQYAKNALIFVPLITSHQFHAELFVKALIAFIAFSLCASSVYLMNDLVDLQADRVHRSKRFRPLASGEISVLHGLYAVPLLLMAAILVAIAVSPALLAVMLCYFALTTAYSFFLKRKMFIDVLALAILYVVRLVAGAVAIEVVVSEWLLTFSMFLFVSLALMKRYVELTARLDSGLSDPTNRNYKRSDLDVVAALAAAAGLNAITVFALYISSTTVHELYRRPQLLWLICPILLYWVSRALLMAHRRHMDDDPIVFALKDRNSLMCGVLIAVVVAAAI
jgi:4-hydroxybenzoate polyprenyltransferase